MDNKSKRLNNREAMEALLAGKKLTRDNWSSCDYIEFDIDKGIIDQNGAFELFRHSSCWEVYEAPKRKVVKTYYQFIYSTGDNKPQFGLTLYSSEAQFIGCCEFDVVVLKTIEHKIEVEE